MDHYDSVKNAFSRGIVGAFIPKTAKPDIDRLVRDGIAIVVKDYGTVVKVLNPDFK